MPSSRRTIFLVLALAWPFLSGCVKVGPDYIRPEPAAPSSWQTPLEGGLNAGQPDPQALAQWWTGLQDPLLTDLIHEAIVGNLDLKQARARLLEARAKREMTTAGLFPRLELSGSATKSRSSEDRGSGAEITLYSGGFDAGWEPDLFGGRQRSVEAAEAQAEASREDLHDVMVSLLAEVAVSSIEARTAQTRLRIARDNLTAQQETLNLIEARRQGGLASDLAVQQARYLEAGTRAQIPTLQSGFAAAANRLAVLLGRHPGSLNERLQGAERLPPLPDGLAVGIPADTLNRRPDIRKAERELAAQTAQVGVAVADLYPSLTLSGSIGLEALSSSRFFNSGNRTWSFGPAFSWPVFDARAIRANIRLQSSLQEEALAKYEATVIAALEEVENALVAYAEEQKRNRALGESAAAAEQAARLADMQYAAGLIDFTTVLDAKRSLLSYQDQLAQSTGTMTANLVRLYKAIGGGWTATSPDPATTNRE